MPQKDPYQSANNLPSYPARKAQVVDIAATDFVPDQVTKALLVGVAGDVVAIMADDLSTVVLKLPVGIHALQIKQINKLLTTATNMVALFG